MDHTTSLPAEILCDIFTWSRLIDPIPNADQLRSLKDDRRRQLISSISPNPYTPPLSLVTASERLAWISVTHTCVRWRTVAIDQTSLWVDLPLVLGPRWFKSFIERSKASPVSLDYSSFSRAAYLNWEQTLELEIIPTLRPRLRTYVTNFEGESKISKMLCLPWPALEELEITAMGRYTALKLLDNYAPKLRVLSFSLYLSPSGSEVFPWTAPFLTGLSVLDLLFAEGIKGTTMPDFLSALGRMANLEHLRLRDNRERSSGACTACETDMKVVSLPRLKTLAFESAGAMIAHVMGHIQPPRSLRLILDAVDGDDWKIYCSRALSWLRQDSGDEGGKFDGFRSTSVILGPTMGRPSIVDFSVSRSVEFPIEQAYTRKWHVRSDLEAGDADLRMKMRREETANDPEDVVDVLQALQLQPHPHHRRRVSDGSGGEEKAHNTFLSLSLTLPLRFPSHELPESFLTPFYTRPLFATVTTLRFNWPLLKCLAALSPGHSLLHHHLHQPLTNDLQSNNSNPDDAYDPFIITPTHIPFPSLHTIDFSHCRLGYVIGWLPAILRDMLKARKEAGVPVKKVVLRMKEDVEDVRCGRMADVRWVLTFRSVEEVLGLVEMLEGLEEVEIVGRGGVGGGW